MKRVKLRQYLMKHLTIEEIMIIKKSFIKDKKILAAYYGKDNTLYNQYVLFVYYKYPYTIPEYSLSNPISLSNMKTLYSCALVAKLI